MAPLLTALLFVLAIAQIGPAPILILAFGWLYWKHDSAMVPIAFFAWSLVIIAIDNVLRPILIKRGADLPLAVIFAGVVGGLIAFGLIGLFIGPVVLAVAYTLLSGWIAEEYAEGG
jgi:predicted PurR-regulated permease PerM